MAAPAAAPAAVSPTAAGPPGPSLSDTVFLDKFGAVTTEAPPPPPAAAVPPAPAPLPSVAVESGPPAESPPPPPPPVPDLLQGPLLALPLEGPLTPAPRMDPLGLPPSLGGFNLAQFTATLLADGADSRPISPVPAPAGEGEEDAPFSMFAAPLAPRPDGGDTPAPLAALAGRCDHSDPAPPLCPTCVRNSFAELAQRIEVQQQSIHRQHAIIQQLSGALSQLALSQGRRSAAPGLPFFSTPDFLPLQKNGAHPFFPNSL